MVSLHQNSSMVTRSNISFAILVVVFPFGIWELWGAATVSGDTGAYVFGAIFVGGAIYALRNLLAETRDLVVAFDADPATGKAKISLWRPFRKLRIETSLDQISGWRHWIQTGTRGRRNFFLLAQEASHAGMLRIELRPGAGIASQLRELAPEAIADFERETKPPPTP
jgi:hypothetical protein